MVVQPNREIWILVTTSLLGITLSFASAVCFGGSSAFLSRPLLKAQPGPVAYLSVLVGIPVVASATIAFGQVDTLPAFPALALALFISAGVLHYGVSRWVGMTATKHIGSNITQPLSTTQVLYSLLFGFLILQEKVDLFTVGGTGLVLFGIVLLEGRLSSDKRGGDAKVGYAAALGQGAIIGFTPILISAGLAISPHFASANLISYVAALAFFAVTMRASRLVTAARNLPRAALYSVAVAGILGAAAQTLRFGALIYAPVVIVIPIAALSILFNLLFTRRIATEFEVFRIRTVISTVITVVGVILVSLS